MLAAVPRPAHVVVVIEENHTLAQIFGASSAPYINALIRSGALFVNSHGVTHPSQPNYFALFAGLTDDNGDGCPASGVPRDAANIASEVLAAHKSFAAYSESLPSAGFSGCWAGTYAQKHAPWVHFSNVPSSDNLPLSAMPAFEKLPTLAFVVPDVDDDMHDGTVAEGDDWLKNHLKPLLAWAAAHDTLVVITWDEGFDRVNTIPTLFLGPMVKPGKYDERITHYRVLRTLEDAEAVAPTGRAVGVAPIGDVWR